MHFFSTVPERRSATEVPVTTTTSVLQTDTPHVTTAPVETECPEPETLPVRTFLPSGLPLRPIATAMLRPQNIGTKIIRGTNRRSIPR